MPFSQAALDFLTENRLRNDREWYREHKADYECLVREPLRELAGALTPVMQRIDPLLVTDPGANGTLSRLYRDVRFSRDKSLYRDVIWCVFTRDRKLFPDSPGLVVEISPGGFRYGGGYYQTPPPIMAALRARVLRNDRLFLLADETLNGQSTFGLEGELYKRGRYPDQPAARRNWLERKGVAVLHNSRDFSLLFSPDLGERLSADFLLMQPVYELLLACSLEAERP